MFIASEQVRAMHSDRESQFCDKVCAELRTEVPTQTAAFGKEHLRKVVAEAIAKAQNYGLVTGDGVRRFVKLAVLIDPAFDQHPDVRRFLTMPDLDADIKIKLLSQLVAKRLREGV